MTEIISTIESIVRPGRRVANGIQGSISRSVLQEVLGSIDENTLIQRLKGVFQPEREVQEVMVPYMNDFMRVITSEPILYKGVSYNPFVTAFGENANLLDFFSWIKR